MYLTVSPDLDPDWSCVAYIVSCFYATCTVFELDFSGEEEKWDVSLHLIINDTIYLQFVQL